MSTIGYSPTCGCAACQNLRAFSNNAQNGAQYYAKPFASERKNDAEVIERCALVADKKASEGCGCWCVGKAIRDLKPPLPPSYAFWLGADHG